MSSAAFSPDHPAPLPSEQLCYVHCNFCDTVLAVSVPCSSLFKTVTVRCGHCANLLAVNMRTLLMPAAASQMHLGNPLLAPAHTTFLDELPYPPPPPPPPPLLQPDLPPLLSNENLASVKGTQELIIQTPPVNRPPEKRQRVPSAYNRFIKEEIQRIKAGNPDITHREAFSAAAKNWAHFPHIHFGLMPDHTLKNSVRKQEGDDVLIKDGLYATAAAAAANMGGTRF